MPVNERKDMDLNTCLRCFPAQNGELNKNITAKRYCK